MPKVVVTEAKLKAARIAAESSGKLIRLWDAAVPGLGVRVQPSGSEGWFLYYSRDDGGGSKAWKSYTLRHTDTATIDDIRREAERVKAGLLQGRDPLDTRQTERDAVTMATEYPRWLGTLTALKDTTQKEYARQWAAYIRTPLGGKKVKDVKLADARALHRAVTTKGGEAIANRVLSRLHTFFNWCEAEELRPLGTNPASFKKLKRNKEREQERFLERDQIARLLEAIETAANVGLPVAEKLKAKKRGANVAVRPSRAKHPVGTTGRGHVKTSRNVARAPYDLVKAQKTAEVKGKVRGEKPANCVAVAALKLLIFTGWREQEALSLRWDAVSVERSAANLAETKTDDSWRPLSAVALDIITSQERAPHAEYVFPGSVKGEPLKEIRHLWYAVRHAAGLDVDGGAPVRLHDLRHTFASVMVSGGASLPMVGAALGHKDMKSTARYAKLMSEAVSEASERAAQDMKAWGAKKSTPVTPIRSGAAS